VGGVGDGERNTASSPCVADAKKCLTKTQKSFEYGPETGTKVPHVVGTSGKTKRRPHPFLALPFIEIHPDRFHGYM